DSAARAPLLVQGGGRRPEPGRSGRCGRCDGRALRRDVDLLRVPRRSLCRPDAGARAPSRVEPSMIPMLLAIATVLSLAALAVVVELAARWWLRSENAYYVFPPGQRLRLHVDRENFPELEPVVRFDVNRDGERGAEVPGVAPGASL